jgi:hypothetical protein
MHDVNKLGVMAVYVNRELLPCLPNNRRDQRLSALQMTCRKVKMSIFVTRIAAPPEQDAAVSVKEDIDVDNQT